MEEFGHLLHAIAALAWPIVALVVAYLFKRPLEELLNSARTRKVVLKIAGQEITMEEANQQQQRMIEDLQVQVLELRRRHEEKPTEVKALPAAVHLLEGPPRKRRLLWVDDNPKNNSFLLQKLDERGFSVDLALSTDEGIKMFAGNSYLLVVSDMGRSESDKYNPTAGLSLLRELRKEDSKVPVIFFTSSDSARKHEKEVRDQGGAGITGSVTELWELIADNLVTVTST